MEGKQPFFGNVCRIQTSNTGQNENGGDGIAAGASSDFFGQPVADLEIFADLPPLVAVLE